MNSVNILNELIQIPSVTGNTIACQQVITFAAEQLAGIGISSTVLTSAGKPILTWGETDLTKTEWLVNSHLDVVPGSPAQFVPFIKSGKVWGRGAADTKSSCAILLSHAKAWDDIARKKHVTFMLVTDEEIGGESTKKILTSMPALRGAVFLEPTGQQMIVQAKGIMQIKITCEGKSTHGSRPWDGKNALEMLSERLTIFHLHHPTPLKETRQTTFNFSLFQAGSAINQVPSSATLWCDVRFNPLDDTEKIIAGFTRDFADCLVEVIKQESPINCSKACRIFLSFASALKANSVNPLAGFEHGSSDARHCTARNIPALVFGPKGHGLHADDEWVDIKSLKLVGGILDTWIKESL